MDEILNSKIRVSDAASALRTQSTSDSNIKPYLRTVIRLNNKLVDEFETEILKTRCDSDLKVPSANVWSWWQNFYEGKFVYKHMQCKKDCLIKSPSEDDVEIWKKIFENSTVEELFEFGISNVSYGWTIIQDKIKFWCAEQKWEKVYSKSNDPNDWIRIVPEYKDLFDGRDLPFWSIEQLADISEKVSSIIQCEIKPGSKLKIYIFKNEKPYTRSALTCYNKLLSKFKNEILDQNGYSEAKEFKEQKMWDIWLIYYEKYLAEKQISNTLIKPVSEDQVKKWSKLLKEKSVEELYEYGSVIIGYAWSLIQLKIRMWCADQKWEQVFSKKLEFRDWYEASNTSHKKLFDGNILPFWSLQEFYDIKEKIATILLTRISPD